MLKWSQTAAIIPTSMLVAIVLVSLFSGLVLTKKDSTAKQEGVYIGTKNFSEETIERLRKKCVPDYTNFKGKLDETAVWSGCLIKLSSGTISTIDIVRGGLIRVAKPGLQPLIRGIPKLQELGHFTGAEIIFLDDPLHETYLLPFIKDEKVLK